MAYSYIYIYIYIYIYKDCFNKTNYFFQVKRVWQRRRVRIADGELWLYHADETKPPVRLTLLTCQVKLPMENVENDSALNHSTSGNQHSVCEGKLNFDLVSNSRTYNFQAEDEQEYEE
ncbi:unnamed protein product [Trichobilharzia regenti]|nr:unnamed protein product [Trichobilharzia regenti]